VLVLIVLIQSFFSFRHTVAIRQCHCPVCPLHLFAKLNCIIILFFMHTFYLFHLHWLFWSLLCSTSMLTPSVVHFRVFNYCISSCIITSRRRKTFP